MGLSIPGFADDQGYPFWFLRKLMNSVAHAGPVQQAGDFFVNTDTGLSVQVGSGICFVPQTVNIEGSGSLGVVYNGLYMVLNDSEVRPFNTITSPVTNPRIDQVIVRVYDQKEQTLPSASFAQIEWLAGTENAGATLVATGAGRANAGAATLPANSWPLAWVYQPVSVTTIVLGNIVNTLDQNGAPVTLGTNVTHDALAITPEGMLVPSPNAFGVNSRRVFMRGGIATTASITAGATLFTLPWPSMFPQVEVTAPAASPSSTTIYSLSIAANGVCTSTSTIASGARISLEGINWWTFG